VSIASNRARGGEPRLERRLSARRISYPHQGRDGLGRRIGRRCRSDPWSGAAFGLWGITEDAEYVQPFHRLDASRNRQSGGAGLVRSIARRVSGGTSLVSSLVGSVSQTLFDGGRIKQHIEIQSAVQEQAVG
jgi:hypothetical protein